MKKIDQILAKFALTPDLIVSKFKKGHQTIYIIYLESVGSNDRVNNFILKNFVTAKSKFKKIEDLLSANIKDIKEAEIEYYLCSGFAIIINNKHIFALETRNELDRSINMSDVEPGLYSPKDSLVENYQKNIGLIKRRIKSSHLKIIENKIGTYTNTTTGLLYMDNIAKSELVADCLAKLKKIKTDAIIASGDLKQFLIKENKNVFPTIKLTERPDTIVKALLEGKIVIIIDTSPFALIIPSFLVDFINPMVDDYNTGITINFLKVLRAVAFGLTIVLPAFYIAITNYSPESIPTRLMMNIANQRIGVPFPSIIEAVMMLLICELLRESDLRFPSTYGSAISILGALVLGESAVSAGISSPIMIIIIAITFISSLMFNDVVMNSAIRTWRYIFLLAAAFLGLYGIIICLLLMITNLCAYTSFSLPYTFPVAPFDIPYLKDTLIKSAKHNDKRRSKYLTDNLRK